MQWTFRRRGHDPVNAADPSILRIWVMDTLRHVVVSNTLVFAVRAYDEVRVDDVKPLTNLTLHLGRPFAQVLLPLLLQLPLPLPDAGPRCAAPSPVQNHPAS